jgi:mono/diheme cytochrome c family protein
MMRRVRLEQIGGAIIALELLGIAMIAMAAPQEQGTLERGRHIYDQRCLDCHGPEGKGDGSKASSLSPRPGNLVSAATSAKSDQDLLRIIANGRPRTAMPAWKDELTEDEQRDVLRYIRSLVRFSRFLTPSPPTPQ